MTTFVNKILALIPSIVGILVAVIVLAFVASCFLFETVAVITVWGVIVAVGTFVLGSLIYAWVRDAVNERLKNGN